MRCAQTATPSGCSLLSHTFQKVRGRVLPERYRLSIQEAWPFEAFMTPTPSQPTPRTRFAIPPGPMTRKKITTILSFRSTTQLQSDMTRSGQARLRVGGGGQLTPACEVGRSSMGGWHAR